MRAERPNKRIAIFLEARGAIILNRFEIVGKNEIGNTDLSLVFFEFFDLHFLSNYQTGIKHHDVHDTILFCRLLLRLREASLAIDVPVFYFPFRDIQITQWRTQRSQIPIAISSFPDI